MTSCAFQSPQEEERWRGAGQKGQGDAVEARDRGLLSCTLALLLLPGLVPSVLTWSPYSVKAYEGFKFRARPDRLTLDLDHVCCFQIPVFIFIQDFTKETLAWVGREHRIHTGKSV